MILYEDRDIIVCHKMAGVAVQSARIGEKDLVSMLNNHLMEQAGGRRLEPVRVVHRLDQPVEGIVVFAKNKKAAASLSAQITDGSMKKVYLAVCCVTEAGGRWMEKTEQLPKEPDGSAGKSDQEREPAIKMHTLIDYLAKDARTNASAVVKKGQKDAKEARLSFRIRTYGKITDSSELTKAAESDFLQYALAEIHLDTGRHHQIRVQMAHAGLPLFGDRKYNPEWERYAKVWQEQMTNASAELALCATKLTFRHPTSGKQMHFQVAPKKKIFQMFPAAEVR